VRVDTDRRQAGMRMHTRSWHWDYVEGLGRAKTPEQRGIRMQRLRTGSGAGRWGGVGVLRGTKSDPGVGALRRRPHSSHSMSSSLSSSSSLPTGSVCSAPPDVWLSDGRYRGQSASQWRWHAAHGSPHHPGPKVPGAPWYPPDPGVVGGGADMAAGMVRSLKNRRKSKMRSMKFKMQASSYGVSGKKGGGWVDIFKHYDTDGSGELDWEEFRKAVRRHGRMSIRSVSDDDLKEVFAIVDTDSGGTVSAEEFEAFLRDPAKGVSLEPALTTDYVKSKMTCGLFNTRAGKGTGLPTGEAAWARIEAAPGWVQQHRSIACGCALLLGASCAELSRPTGRVACCWGGGAQVQEVGAHASRLGQRSGVSAADGGPAPPCPDPSGAARARSAASPLHGGCAAGCGRRRRWRRQGQLISHLHRHQYAAPKPPLLSQGHGAALGAPAAQARAHLQQATRDRVWE
jgi:hypothetical protein